jgi:hypothetical protein
MFKSILLVCLLAFLLGCSASNSSQQKNWPGSDQSAESKKSTNTETGPNTSAPGAKKADDRSGTNFTKRSPQAPDPQASPKLNPDSTRPKKPTR